MTTEPVRGGHACTGTLPLPMGRTCSWCGKVPGQPHPRGMHVVEIRYDDGSNEVYELPTRRQADWFLKFVVFGERLFRRYERWASRRRS